MNTLLVKGQTVELQCWLWTISSLVGLFSEMLIQYPGQAIFTDGPLKYESITGCETNGALVEIFLLSHLQSGYGNWSANWLHLSYKHGTIYPEAYCHHHKISWRIHHKNLISLSSPSSSVICQTTGPKPLPKRFLHTVRSRASSFNWQYPQLSSRSSSSFLRLLPRLLCPFIIPSITCCRRQFLRKMWPIQLAFHFLISCRIFLCSMTK